MNRIEGVEIRRVFDAPPDRVFSAFADASLVSRWLRPSQDVKLTVLDFDFRVGGAYRFAYDVPDGGRMIVGGTYSVIERPYRISFSWLIEPPDEHAGIASEVRVVLTRAGSRTELLLRHEKLDRANAEVRHEAGWAGAFDLLGGLLEQRSKP